MNHFIEQMGFLRPQFAGFVIALMLGSLLLAACGPHLSVDFNYRGPDDEVGFGSISESGVFSMVVMLLLGIFGLVLALGRNRKYR